MIFGQLNNDYAKGSVPMDPAYINRNPQIFSKYEVVADHNCLDEVDEQFHKTSLHKLLGMTAQTRKVQRPSLKVYMKGHQLICHPTLAKNIERTLREYTASLLDSVE